MSMHLHPFQTLQTQFEEAFGKSNEELRFFFAPGRVNLIGEHIDYCGGKVLPATIQRGTYAIARRSSNAQMVLKSMQMENKVTFSPQHPTFLESDGWGNFPKGIVAEYLERGISCEGLEVLFHGNISGGGLSSSASLEVCMALILEAFSNIHLDADPFENQKQIAWLCQHSENTFNGLNCGIMDQGAIALGRSEQAMLMDCRTLDVEYIPVELGDYRILIGNTCKPRSLIESKYNERRSETEQALALLQTQFSIETLCELPPAQLQTALSLLEDPILKKRTRHIVLENHRVHLASQALSEGNLSSFGQLLVESHDSLRDDYEVTGPELDALVSASLDQPGVLGARMTGAGFGGCMIALVAENQIESFIHNVTRQYQEAIGYVPEFHETLVGPGAHEVFLS